MASVLFRALLEWATPNWFGKTHDSVSNLGDETDVYVAEELIQASDTVSSPCILFYDPATPLTLPELLQARAVSNGNPKLTFLRADGTVSRALSYADLFDSASTYARRLLAAGLTKSDIVLASFQDHESHINTFWACCLAGIPFCPLPALHPDPNRQVMLFNHLQLLFHKPTLIASKETVKGVLALVPDIKSLILEELPIADVNSSAHIFPTRRPSPKDTVCFMLTSGSTGNSKAVSLSHSNLLSSIRGKIDHHGTTAESRFLNWIAFDHVACVSEVHLQALEANASQWHVAPSAIIHNPLNLLKWASTHKITYTFSPNFLLAAILRDHSSSMIDESFDLSSLQALISGGEAVPVKTAMAFTDIIENLGARRDVLRAGFGMSETGAGSIYDTREIPRDDTLEGQKYLSLGKCCKGITARIADPETGKLCLHGEIGHLQVSGPTVFTGYYGNERATKESFTDDGWFITGDLAQFDPDGNLSLVGRGKDCININGIKHPTQDVEHYVEDANIEGIMPSYVFVCPMRLDGADTETYGVFYQHNVVFEKGIDALQKQSIRATNKAIKNACTIFCSQAPHIVLPLPRSSFIKTALGKISHSQLSKTYLEGKFKDLQVDLEACEDLYVGDTGLPRPSDFLLSEVEKVVSTAISAIFSVDSSSLRRSQNIFDIGASSMHLLRLKQEIQDCLFISDLPTIEMLKRPDIGGLCDYLSEVMASEKSGYGQIIPEYDPLVCFNRSGNKPPLFLVHPGVGEVLVFVGLARRFAHERPVYALRARGFDHNESAFGTFQEMVDCYASSIRKVYPSGPYNIAGYSFGGAVAFEIGKALETKGKDVSFIGILNLPPHIQFRMHELSWAEVLLNISMFLSLIPSSALDSMRQELKRDIPEVAITDTKPLDPHTPINWLLKRADKERLLELNIEIGAFARWVNVAYEINRTGRNFEPQGHVQNALTTVFCAIPLPSMGTREEYKRDRLSAWSEFSGERFEMVDVDGEHYTMLSEDHVESFSAQLKHALHRAESC